MWMQRCARPESRRLLRAVLLAVMALSACGRGSAEGGLHEFVIPEGAYERTAAGEDLDIIPAEIEVEVGDRLRLVNEDDVGQTIGPYYVGPQSTLDKVFGEPGVFEGLCTAHPERSIRIVVNEADGT
jgi:plastocyanin